MDADDIEDLMDDYFFDEEVDDEKEIKKIKLKKKKTIAKAKDYFEQQKEQYSVPLESRREAAPEESEEYKAYKQYVAEAKTVQEQNLRVGEVFTEKTNNVFGSEFKGFELH